MESDIAANTTAQRDRPQGFAVIGAAAPWIPPRGICRVALYTPRGYQSTMKPVTKQTCLRRLSRIEGQVRGLARMVEEDRYCIDVVTQIAAVKAALRRVEEEILREHVGH